MKSEVIIKHCSIFSKFSSNTLRWSFKASTNDKVDSNANSAKGEYDARFPSK